MPRLNTILLQSRAIAAGVRVIFALISGLKLHQLVTRANMAILEDDGAGRLKLNPLATWKKTDLAAYFDRHNRPRRLLRNKCYHSIGCAPCTFKVMPSMDNRAGRCAGKTKTECGIYFPSKAHKQSGAP
jgi:phosphoadenosine phosphosulfate reductase